MKLGRLRAFWVALTTFMTAAPATAAVREPVLPRVTDHELRLTTSSTAYSEQKCKRWRALANRLGETHAGHTLRQTVVSRFCALNDDGSDHEVWSWPWRHQDVRADLPPHLHGQFGAWQIRCGHAGLRRRCALSLETMAAAGLRPDDPAMRVVSHIVIDTVAGRESVLWRVHVADPGMHPNTEAERKAGISLLLADRPIAEPFDACGHRGCLAEADPKLSAEVASWLWSGKPLALSIARTSQDAAGIAAMLPADGFRQGLSELIRLRRHEGRAVAGR